IYVFGGVDDALAKPGVLRIAPWPAGANSPTDYRTLSYGRDYFAGFVFKLNEEDAARMLRLYGSFVGAILYGPRQKSSPRARCLPAKAESTPSVPCAKVESWRQWRRCRGASF